MHLGLTVANGGLAAVMARRTPTGGARAAVWCWLVLSGVATLPLSMFGQLLGS